MMRDGATVNWPPVFCRADLKGTASVCPSPMENRQMLMTIALVLIVLWVLGMITSYTMGGIIHVLLVVAVIVFLVQVIQGRRLK